VLDGVNHHFVVASIAKRPVLGERQLQRRAAQAAGLLVFTSGGHTAALRQCFKALFAYAQKREGVCVVPMAGRSVLSAKTQARLVTSAKLSGQQWSKLRQVWGCKDSGLVSTQWLMSELRELRADEVWVAVTTEMGTRLVSIRAALECLLA